MDADTLAAVDVTTTRDDDDDVELERESAVGVSRTATVGTAVPFFTVVVVVVDFFVVVVLLSFVGDVFGRCCSRVVSLLSANFGFFAFVFGGAAWDASIIFVAIDAATVDCVSSGGACGSACGECAEGGGGGDRFARFFVQPLRLGSGADVVDETVVADVAAAVVTSLDVVVVVVVKGVVAFVAASSVLDIGATAG